MLEEIKDILPEKKGFNELLKGMEKTGFQATHLGEAIDLIEQVKNDKCTLFFGFTANLVASGLRGIVAEICSKKFVNAVVTTAGSIDHDVIKSFLPYLKGQFFVDDVLLHKKGINRIGNIFVPNDRFELFEEKMQQWLKELYKKNKTVSTKELNEFIGTKLNKSSFLYWCSRNKMPVFCPAITDGAIGLQLHFFKQEHNDFVVDAAADLKDLAALVLNSEKTAAIILGGGIAKHHIIGANLLRGGLDYAIYITTAQEFDGSLSGAKPREGKSWGKIREKGKSIIVNGDATILFPLIAAALRERKLL